jgi:hypothetical protein
MNLTVAGLSRTAVVEGSPTASLGIVCLHGHNMQASKFIDNFSSLTGTLRVAPQALEDDLGEEGWIRPDSVAKFHRRYPGLDGTEDFQLVERLIELHPGVETWVTLGFSGGAGFLRSYLKVRKFPFQAAGLACNGGENELVNGKFTLHPDNQLPPIFFQWGTNDRFHSVSDMEVATAAWVKTFATVEKRRKLLTICGKSVERRVYADADLDVYVVQGGGHSLLTCSDGGTAARYFGFVNNRLGL